MKREKRALHKLLFEIFTAAVVIIWVSFSLISLFVLMEHPEVRHLFRKTLKDNIAFVVVFFFGLYAAVKNYRKNYHRENPHKEMPPAVRSFISQSVCTIVITGVLFILFFMLEGRTWIMHWTFSNTLTVWAILVLACFVSWKSIAYLRNRKKELV